MKLPAAGYGISKWYETIFISHQAAGYESGFVRPAVGHIGPRENDLDRSGLKPARGSGPRAGWFGGKKRSIYRLILNGFKKRRKMRN